MAVLASRARLERGKFRIAENVTCKSSSSPWLGFHAEPAGGELWSLPPHNLVNANTTTTPGC
jgi:hypothetical protein